MTVLVAYASRQGSTHGIAERIADRLGEHGLRIDLRAVDDPVDAGAYDAVVFGAPVYDQAWPPEAEEFVQRNLDALSERPVWLFSVGSLGDRKRLIGPLARKEPRRIGEVQRAIQPRDYRVFAGVVQPGQWSRLGDLVLRAFGGHVGDNRDWPDIDAWANRIAAALSRPAVP